jgi:hypothetical protein
MYGARCTVNLVGTQNYMRLGKTGVANTVAIIQGPYAVELSAETTE